MLWGWKLQYFIRVNYRKKNKTTEPNEFRKNDDSSALGISWATEPGWVPHYISPEAFSSKKRINMGIFFTGAGGSNSARFTIHTKTTMGHWRQARVAVRARFQKHGEVSAAVLQRQHSRDSHLVLKSTKNTKNPHMQVSTAKGTVSSQQTISLQSQAKKISSEEYTWVWIAC